MKLNKSRRGELVFKTKRTFKIRVTKQNLFCMDHITKLYEPKSIYS